MKVADLPDILECTIFTPGSGETVITGGYTSDLLSDVMGNALEGDILITIQGHKNSVAVAHLGNLPAILLCNGRKAPEDMIKAAEQEGIAIFSTTMNQFLASHRIAVALGIE